MRQLFWRIFLSVLLTVLLTFAVSLQIAFWVLPRPPEFRPDSPMRGSEQPGSPDNWHSRIGALLELHAPAVAATIEHEGPAAALKQIEGLAAAWDVRMYLVDEQGVDVGGQELSPTARRLAQQAQEHDGVQFAGWEPAVAIGLGASAAGGRPYVLIGEAPGGPAPPRSIFAWMTALRLGSVVIGLGVVCYILARYITSPVLKLRGALRRFAQGDLEQRVAAAIGARRDEIGELARDFDDMAERIATLVGAQRRLLQDISHELRSPLARQRVALELARRPDRNDAARALDRAEQEAERLDELIAELLTLNRLESGKDVAECSSVDLVGLVHEVIENARFESRNDTRSIQLIECASCIVTAVPELLRRAIENVVRNALAYTADETVVEVALCVDGPDAVMCVRDHGPGVPEAELGDIFRPFYRVSRARERSAGGTGLGLAIASRAIHTHGGSIVARNVPEGGLIVEIRFPCNPPLDD